MAQAKTPTPTGGYREDNNICFTWNRNVPPAYNHFDVIWGVYYAGGWNEDSGTVDKTVKDSLSYFTEGYNQTGDASGIGNYATSSYSKAFRPQDWYPFHNRICTGMWFKVRGDTAATSASTDETRSAWSLVKMVHFAKPTKPECSATHSGGSTTFTWRNPDGDRNLKWCSEVQIQTKLEPGNWVTVNADTSWGEATISSSDWGKTAGSCTLTESTTTQAGAKSRTRRFRARSRGPMGASAWAEVTAWIWAKPNVPTVFVTGSGRNSASDYLKWSYSPIGPRPAETLVVERCVGTPTTAADALPEDPTWTNGDPIALSYSRNSKGVTGMPVSSVGLDECVWMRATAHHGDLSTASRAIVTYRGRLKAPSDLAVSQSGTNVSLNWTNNTEVPGASVRISRRGTASKDWIAVDTLAGTATGGTTSYTITGVASGTAWDYKVEAVKDGWITSEASAVYNLGRPSKPEITRLAYWENGNFVTVYWSDPDTATTEVELAWASSRIAWDSTEGYQTKTLNRRKAYNIDSGVEPGSTVYVRVRFINDDLTGSWSDTASVLCAATPDTPVLESSKAVIKPGDELGFAWTYANDDGSTLSMSTLYVTRGGITRKHFVGNGSTQTSLSTSGWSSGDTVTVKVAVTSANGKTSAVSDTVSVNVLAAPSPTIALGRGGTWAALPYKATSDGEGADTKVRTLTASPLNVKVTGGGDGGTVTIRREGDHRVEHADGTVDRGADGERVAVGAYTGSTAYVVFDGVDFDDGFLYRAEVAASNDAGSGTAVSEPFRVEWSNQADAPSADCSAEGLSAIIRPHAVDSNEKCDVYRITAEGLQLVMANAEWDSRIIDPYAPLGKHGATHRVVSRTADGDEAWTDFEAGNPQAGIVVDWDGKRLSLPYNTSFSDSYTKEYASTRHRGGTITGKWLEGVEREASWSTDVIRVAEQDKLLLLRELAQWCGECYVRGPGGVGFPCNVEVSVSAEYGDGAVGVSLTALRIDSNLWGGEYS